MCNLHKFIILFLCLTIGYTTVEGTIEEIDQILVKLKKGFKHDNEAAKPSILGRVHILADIYNGINAKFKNLTNNADNMRDAYEICTKRVSQLKDYKILSLDYMEREVLKMNDKLTAVHKKVQNFEITGLAIANAILPYTTKYGFFAERINTLLRDDNVTSLIASYRAESYRLFGPSREFYREIENEIYGNLQTLLDRVLYLYRSVLKTQSLADVMAEHVNELKDVDPNKFDLFGWQYEMGRGLFVTKQLLTTIIQCEAILEGQRDPFIRVRNKIYDQQSREFFGAYVED